MFWFIPIMTSIYIHTQGCSLNSSDSEVIAGLVKKAGFQIVQTPEESDLIIFNSCIVKRPTENAFYKKLEEFKALNKQIIVAGCIPQVKPKKLRDFSLIGTDQINNIVEVVEETINGNIVKLLTRENNPRLNLAKIRKNDVIEILPICKGCLGEPCSYCTVKNARGHLFSYEKEAIIKQAETAVNEGAKELWLTAQDTGAYGKDIEYSLPKLLNALLKIDGKFLIRVGMMNPNHILEFLDELIDIYKHDKIFKFLHLPVQSGNDDILRLMKRKYFASDFKAIVNSFREEIPEITISTDIICGFPTETFEQFQDSVNLIKEIKPDVLNISRFWPRPFTEAEKMEQLSGEETKKRSRLLTSTFEWLAFEKNKKWREWKGKILIDEKGKENTWVGRNFAYRPVIIESSDFLLGKKLNVKIINTTKHDLRGVVINEPKL